MARLNAKNSNVKISRKYGFLKRMSTKKGREILKRRRLKGRFRLVKKHWRHKT